MVTDQGVFFCVSLVLRLGRPPCFDPCGSTLCQLHASSHAVELPPEPGCVVLSNSAQGPELSGSRFLQDAPVETRNRNTITNLFLEVMYWAGRRKSQQQTV